MNRKSEKKSKKIYCLIVFFSISFYLCNAQLLSERQHGKLETIKMSYITKELNLSDKEARRFWVIYPQYLKDMSLIRGDYVKKGTLYEEKISIIRRKYHYSMFSILKSNERVNKVFMLERNYREMLRNELKKRINSDSSN